LVPTLLPKLRRSEIKVKGFMRIRPVDTLKQIAEEQGLDSLHRKELIKLAYRSNDVDRKREIYKHYTERYPDHWVGHNNLKALLLFEGKYQEALKAFKELKDRYPNKGPILNNLGVAYRHAHKYEKARENYKAAKQKGVDERNNMGILDIKVAEYASATENFEADRKDYNVALAHTLAGSHDKALSVIDNITTKTADVYYLKAIVAARKGDKELMTTSLRRAVEKGEGIRDRAKNDLEFRDYKDSEAFKNALRY
jgi:tetratricopeptide (TPR) repeat protein